MSKLLNIKREDRKSLQMNDTKEGRIEFLKNYRKDLKTLSANGVDPNLQKFLLILLDEVLTK